MDEKWLLAQREYEDLTDCRIYQDERGLTFVECLVPWHQNSLTIKECGTLIFFDSRFEDLSTSVCEKHPRIADFRFLG